MPTVKSVLCIILKRLAGASYLDVGWLHAVGIATMYQIVDGTVLALNIILPFLSFPISETQCQQQAESFQTSRNSPIYEFLQHQMGSPQKYHSLKSVIPQIQKTITAGRAFMLYACKPL